MNFRASAKFVHRVVTNFECKLYRDGEYIATSGQSIQQLFFINLGEAHLYMSFKWNNEEIRHKLTEFKPGSWYGDY